MPLTLKTRNVSLTPEIEAFINASVTSGRFRSASEVVRAAMRLLVDQEQRRETSGEEARHPNPPARLPMSGET